MARTPWRPVREKSSWRKLALAIAPVALLLLG